MSTHPAVPGRGKDDRGFTILELLVALAIVALVLGIVAARFGGSRTGPGVELVARSMAAGLRLTRDAAIRTNGVSAYLIDAASGIYGPQGSPPRPVPPGFGLFLGAGRSGGLNQLRILFFADGSSSGGRVLISGGGERAEIDVDWVTGLVATRTPG